MNQLILDCAVCFGGGLVVAAILQIPIAHELWFKHRDRAAMVTPMLFVVGVVIALVGIAALIKLEAAA